MSRSEPPLEGERKQVTVLYAALKAFGEHVTHPDREEVRVLLGPALDRMVDAVHQYEGTVSQVLTDGIMALFGAPLAHEDHAVRACYAALRMQESVRRYAEDMRHREGVPIQIWIGVNSGEVIVRSGARDVHVDAAAVGQTAHLAERVLQLGTSGATIISADTAALAEGYVQTRPLGRVPGRGLEIPRDLHELVGPGRARSRFQAAAVRGLTRFIGRSREVEQLTGALARAGRGHGQVVAVVGEPGVGKSRLIHEFARSPRTAGWRVLEGGSPSHGRRTAYLPIVELIRAFAHVDVGDDSRTVRDKVTTSVLGLDEALRPVLPPLLAMLDVPVDDAWWRESDPQQRRQRTLDAVKRLLIREGLAEPLMVIVEDLQWLDEETQTVLDTLVDAVVAARVMLLVSYRPEYRHGWSGKAPYQQIRLDNLPADDADNMLGALLGDEPAVALKPLLVARAGGNPLYLEESVRVLVDTGVVAGERGAYRLLHPIETIQVPATVHAILAARIDRLDPEEKRLLQSASVIGRDASLSMLQGLEGELSAEALRRGLARLQAREFLHETSLFPEIQYSFCHALTHDVAYGALTPERRRALHTRLVDVIERQLAGSADQTAMLAHHALHGEMWDKATAAFRKAAARAGARSAYQEAVGCLEQALRALGHLRETRGIRELAVDLRLDLHAALIPLGDLARMLETLNEAERLAGSLGDQRRLGRVAAYMTQCLWWMGHPTRAVDSGERALAIARKLGDHGLEAVTHVRLAQAYTSLGQYRRAIDAFRRNLDMMLEASHRRSAVGADQDPRVIMPRAWTAWCLSYLGEFEDATAAADEALRRAEQSDHQLSVATAYGMTALPHLFRGQFARAIWLLERGLAICNRESFLPLSLLIAGDLGQAYALTGQVGKAVALLEDATLQSESVRIMTTHAFTETWLAEAYSLAGRPDDAVRTARSSLDRTRRHGQRWLEAGVLRVLGDILTAHEPAARAEAEACYRDALQITTALGMRPWQGRSHLALGRFHRRGGDASGAERELAAAVAIFRDLGMSFWLETAEAEIRERRDP
jgi:class 3 adenylate cyclase/tetratricopeptide (TPR) repeat protein